MIRTSLRSGEPIDLLMLVSALLSAASPDDAHPLQARRAGPTLDDLVESFIGTNFAETTACLAVMRVLIDDEVTVDRIDAELIRRRQPMPAWITGLRDARVADDVWLFADIQGDGDDYLIEVALGSGDVLTALVYVDHNLGTLVKDAFWVPGSASAVRQRLLELQEDDGTTLEPTDPADARVIIEQAIALGGITYPPLETETWPACRPLLEWALRGLPTGGSAPEPREWTSAELEQIADDFLASSFGTAHDHPDGRGLLESMLWFASGYSGTDPYRWSPVRVEILLTDWFPRKVIADHAFLAAMPDVLRAFIRYSDHRVGMPSDRTASTLAAVDEWEPQYQQMIRAERLQGAHALAARLMPDFGDVDAWQRGFAFDMLALLERRVGGRVQLMNLDEAPLPDERFIWEGIPVDIRPVVESMLADCDRVADEVEDIEFRTGMRRLLGRVAVGDPALFRRRASPTRGAAAVAWIIHRANHESFGPELLVQDLLAKFGVHGSVSQRADPMLRAIGVDPSMRYIWIDVASGDLLTSKTRAAIIRMRDRNLKTLEADVDSE